MESGRKRVVLLLESPKANRGMPAYKREWYLANRERIVKRNTVWRANNPDKLRNSVLVNKYGITLAQYNELLMKQGRRCAICRTVDPGNGPRGRKRVHFSVDHCHKTGKTRGLLCNQCNRVLGLLQDSVDVAESAVQYLKKHRVFRLPARS